MEPVMTFPVTPEDNEERVGLILHDGSVIELPNTALHPEKEFRVDPVLMIQHENNMVATWHSHLSGPPAPSGRDIEAFLMWPHLRHWIVTPEGAQEFYVDRKRVLKGAKQCA